MRDSFVPLLLARFVNFANLNLVEKMGEHLADQYHGSAGDAVLEAVGDERELETAVCAEIEHGEPFVLPQPPREMCRQCPEIGHRRPHGDWLFPLLCCTLGNHPSEHLSRGEPHLRTLRVMVERHD